MAVYITATEECDGTAVHRLKTVRSRHKLLSHRCLFVLAFERETIGEHFLATRLHAQSTACLWKISEQRKTVD